MPERRNFFKIARSSAQECVPLFEIARRHNIAQISVAVALKDWLEVIARMLSGLINGLDK